MSSKKQSSKRGGASTAKQLPGGKIAETGNTSRCTQEKRRVNASLVQPEKTNRQFSLKRTLYLSFFLISVAALAASLILKEREKSTSSVDVKHDEFVSVPEESAAMADVEASTPEIAAQQTEGVGRSSLLNSKGVDFFKRGMFEDALAKFEEALALSPESDMIMENIANSYLWLGWARYKERKYDDALENFEASLKAKATAQGHKGRGMAYMNLGDHFSAMESFESSLEMHGKDANVHMMVGSILYRENRLEEAKDHFERVLKISPVNVEAARFLAKIRREGVEEGFRDKESFHFHVKYEGAERGEVGHLVSLILEEAYHKVGSDLGFYPEDMITAILYTDRQFRDVTRAPSWSGGVYDGKIRLPAGGINRRTEDLVRVVYHEYTHAVIHRITGGNCPAWLNEGIAQYEEGRAALARAESVIKRDGRLMTLKYLERSFRKLNPSEISGAYAMSLLAVDYIVSEFGMSNLKNIFDSLGEGINGEEAISSTIYLSYDDIERGVRRRFKGH